MKLIPITLTILVFLSGCASARHLGELPSLEEEFNLPIDELKQKYPDISEYDKGLGYCTGIDEFISKLGEPSRIDIETFQVPFLSIPIGVAAGGPGGAAVVVISYSMYPKQPRQYYWIKGKYLISARVLTDFSCGYSNRVHRFEWRNVN